MVRDVSNRLGMPGVSKFLFMKSYLLTRLDVGMERNTLKVNSLSGEKE